MNKYFIILFFLSFVIATNAQTDSNLVQHREKALNIYIDCDNCDMVFLRQNLTIVNYVRDRMVADVHLIVTEMDNGGGGDQYTIQFIGQGRYSHLRDTLVFNTKADATEEENRKLMLSAFQKGLFPFILKTDYADRMTLNFIEDEHIDEAKDPWNSWVFDLDLYLIINASQSLKSTDASVSVSASKITEQIKHNTSIDQGYSENKFRIYNENDSLVYSLDVYSNNFFGRHSTVWSLGDHWGAGIEGNLWKSTYSNTDFAWDVMPAIEYNLFPYKQASQKQFRITYAAGFSHYNYTDTTIYNKLTDDLPYHKLVMQFKHITNWGSVEASLQYKNFLRDFSLYYLGSSISTEIKLFKGLSLSLVGSFTMPRNQVGLVKSVATTEEVLLQQHELKTQFSYYTVVGLSYTFGSIYNNVVNPRLD